MDELIAQCRESQEIIVALAGRLPEGLLAALTVTVSEKGANSRAGLPLVQVLIERFDDPDYVERVYLAGARLHEGLGLPEETVIIIDRKAGYLLPSLQRVPDPFGLACRLLWRRFGVVIRLEGGVEEACRDGEMFLLRLPSGWTGWVMQPKARPRVGVLPGQAVTVLGLDSWMVSVIYAIKVQVSGAG